MRGAIEKEISDNRVNSDIGLERKGKGMELEMKRKVKKKNEKRVDDEK